jgi:hypothetical protein
MFELSQYEVDQCATAAEAQKASNWEKLHRFLFKNHIVIGESVEKAFYCQECTDGICTGKGDHLNHFGNTFSTQSLNEENFQTALDGRLLSLKKYAKVHIPTKEEIISDILDLLRSPDPSGRGGRYSAFNLKSVEKQMQSWSLNALELRRDEIIREQDLVKLSASALRKIVVDARPQFNFPKFPRTQMQGMTVVQIDRAYLKSLPSHEIRRLCRIYSDAAVNARLAE